MFLDDRVEAALDFHRHRHGSFYAGAALAVRAGLVHRIAEGFVEALARHFHEADVRDLKDLGFGLVLFEAVFDRFVDRLLILAVAHVDEVDHDEAADVAEAELACDFASGLDVGF